MKIQSSLSQSTWLSPVYRDALHSGIKLTAFSITALAAAKLCRMAPNSYTCVTLGVTLFVPAIFYNFLISKLPPQNSKKWMVAALGVMSILWAGFSFGQSYTLIETLYHCIKEPNLNNFSVSIVGLTLILSYLVPCIKSAITQTYSNTDWKLIDNFHTRQNELVHLKTLYQKLVFFLELFDSGIALPFQSSRVNTLMLQLEDSITFDELIESFNVAQLQGSDEDKIICKAYLWPPFLMIFSSFSQTEQEEHFTRVLQQVIHLMPRQRFDEDGNEIPIKTLNSPQLVLQEKDLVNFIQTHKIHLVKFHTTLIEKIASFESYEKTSREVLERLNTLSQLAEQENLKKLSDDLPLFVNQFSDLLAQIENVIDNSTIWNAFKLLENRLSTPLLSDYKEIESLESFRKLLDEYKKSSETIQRLNSIVKAKYAPQQYQLQNDENFSINFLFETLAFNSLDAGKWFNSSDTDHVDEMLKSLGLEYAKNFYDKNILTDEDLSLNGRTKKEMQEAAKNKIYNYICEFRSSQQTPTMEEASPIPKETLFDHLSQKPLFNKIWSHLHSQKTLMISRIALRAIALFALFFPAIVLMYRYPRTALSGVGFGFIWETLDHYSKRKISRWISNSTYKNIVRAFLILFYPKTIFTIAYDRHLQRNDISTLAALNASCELFGSYTRGSLYALFTGIEISRIGQRFFKL